jgi:nucleoside transporter
VYRFKLSLMMFLEFFIWGAWFPLVFGYLPSLGFNALQQGVTLGAFNLAAFTAMFFSTQFVDRNFAAEKFLAFSHLVGGVAILALGWVTDFWPFFALILLHSLFYVPTISITNSIAFANLKDPQREFGPVRLWGTIGWIVASVPFVFILVDWARVPAMSEVGFVDWLRAALGTGKTGAALREATRFTFVAAGLASLVLAAISLGLPHTPPKPATAGREQLAWLEALRLLRVPFLLVLFIVTFFDAMVHQCYFFWTARFLENSVGIEGNWIMPVMTIGQIAEIGTMAILGLALKGLGWRTTMVIGVLGHAVRFAVFAASPPPWLAITVNVLHGICYAFFFATVYIFVDEFFPKDARASAQGLFNFLILGLGPFVGNFIWGWLGEVMTTQVGPERTVVNFHELFLVPTAVAVAAALILLVFFHPPASARSLAFEPPSEGPGGRAEDVGWAERPSSEAITDRSRSQPPASDAITDPDRHGP